MGLSPEPIKTGSLADEMRKLANATRPDELTVLEEIKLAAAKGSTSLEVAARRISESDQKELIKLGFKLSWSTFYRDWFIFWE